MSSDSDSVATDASNALPLSQRETVEKSCLLHQGIIKGFLRGILGREELVEEAFQRTVLKAIQSADSVNVAKIRGWLFRIALNEARQIIRSTRTRKQHESNLLDDLPKEPGSRENSEAERRVEDAESVRIVREAIQLLSPEYQVVLTRRLFGETPFVVIAEELGVPIGTVLTWMRRGLEKLRDNPRIRELL